MLIISPPLKVNSLSSAASKSYSARTWEQQNNAIVKHNAKTISRYHTAHSPENNKTMLLLNTMQKQYLDIIQRTHLRTTKQCYC